MLEDEDRCNLVSRRQGSASPLVDARERHLAVTDLSCNYWVEAGSRHGEDYSSDPAAAPILFSRERLS